MTTQFYRVSAPAGSGKTYQAIRWAIKCAHYKHQKTVIVFKTNQLMQQAYGDAEIYRDELLSDNSIDGKNNQLPIIRINSDNLGIDGKSIAFQTGQKVTDMGTAFIFVCRSLVLFLLFKIGGFLLFHQNEPVRLSAIFILMMAAIGILKWPIWYVAIGQFECKHGCVCKLITETL